MRGGGDGERERERERDRLNDITTIRRKALIAVAIKSVASSKWNRIA